MTCNVRIPRLRVKPILALNGGLWMLLVAGGLGLHALLHGGAAATPPAPLDHFASGNVHERAPHRFSQPAAGRIQHS